MDNLHVIGFPGLYMQGPGALQRVPRLLADWGVQDVGLVCDDIVREAAGAGLEAALAQAGRTVRWLRFGGECTLAAIHALATAAGGCDAIVGLGGGKTIDTAKGVARACGSRLLIAPTIASNDSPTSRLIVVYDEAHRLVQVDMLARNPDAVVVDTTVICRAPARFFAAGVGDALSKRIEAAQCAVAGATNFLGGLAPALPQILGEHCERILWRDAEAALVRVRSGLGPDATVERVIEATVLYSGVAFESGGLSLAHALNRGFTALPRLAGLLHGEMVAFGTLVQRMAEGEATAELEAFARLLLRLNLPVHFGMLCGNGIDPGELPLIAEQTLAAPYMRHFRPVATTDAIVRALQAADRVGRAVSGSAGGRKTSDE